MSAPIDFEQLFQRSPNCYMLVDRDLRFVACNDAYLHVTASRREALIGRNLFDVFPNDPDEPDNRSARELRASFAKVLAEGVPDTLALIRYRVPLHTERGVVSVDRFWSATHTPIFDAGGAVAYILQHTVDVTELQQLERTSSAVEGGSGSTSRAEAGVLTRAQVVQETNRLLDTERRRLLQLFEQAPGFVCFLHGKDHVFELANEAYLQLVGHRDIIGKPVREALPEVQGQGFYELLDQVFASGRPFVGSSIRVMLERHPGATAREVYVDFVYQPILEANGLVSGILVQGHDITEQKVLEERRTAAEAARAESEERLRRVVEASGVGTWEMDLGSGAVTADARMLEMFDLERLPSLPFERFLERIHPDDRTRAQQWVEQAGLRASEASRVIEHRIVTSTGIERWVEIRGQVFFDDTGTGLRFLGTGLDITERKRAEQERERLLERESTARREAEEANRLKDEFLTTVSHELRTPLTAMLGWVQMLRTGKLPEEKRERALETVERNARAQAQLIEDLLDVSRIMSGKLGLEIEPVEISGIVDQALETVRPAAEAKGVKLWSEIDGASRVLGDPQRLQQVVWNLLSNAVKFTPSGGRVSVRIEHGESAVKISVADTGRGIAAEFLPHVFERFRQAEGGTARRTGGLGLGLSIVRQLVEMHGGSVAVSSEGEGRGATFTVTLPHSAALRRDPVPTPPPVHARNDDLSYPTQLEDLHILLVDDEPDTRELVRTLLEGCGARVTVAGSAAEGLAALQNEPPDLLVSDIGMPGTDGFSFIRQVRALSAGEGGRTPAVALTAYARAEDRTRVLLAGFQSHVPKPVEPVELLAVLSSLAGRVAPQR